MPKLILYVRSGCQFCAKALNKLTELSLPFEERNIGEEAHRAELIEKGGKQQVPYLIDETAGVSMYESDDIVNYLGTTYGMKVPAEAK